MALCLVSSRAEEGLISEDVKKKKRGKLHALVFNKLKVSSMFTERI